MVPELRKCPPSGWYVGVLLIVLFALAAVIHVRSRHLVVQSGYRLSDATREHERLMADYRKLQVEVATLKNPRRLRELAASSLNLFEPKASQIVCVDEEPEGKLALQNK